MFSSETVKCRMSTLNNQGSSSTPCFFDDHKHGKVDYTDPLAVSESAQFGSVTKDIYDLFRHRADSVNPNCGKDTFNVTDDTIHDTKVLRESRLAPIHLSFIP